MERGKMNYRVNAVTCRGERWSSNQDSLYVKHGVLEGEEFIMAIVCDGMGGICNGRYASSEVVKTFSSWSDHCLPEIVRDELLPEIANQWKELLQQLNHRFMGKGVEQGVTTGTTFTAMFFHHSHYLIMHIGNSGIYRITDKVELLTTDHTVTGEKIRKGQLTPEEGKHDRGRTMLLQCIGASSEICPEIIYGKTEPGIYCLCTDGLRNRSTEELFLEYFSPEKNRTEHELKTQAHGIMEDLSERGEDDNMSVILILAQ